MQTSDRPIPAKESNFLAQNPHLGELAAGQRSGFDPDSPPDPKLLDSCVHCGFCLSTCPSYRVLGKETDSPRGRIYLMDAINEGTAELDRTTAQHFDTCLGCLACVTTCPSGVKYDQLISATRPQVERNVPRSLPEQALRTLIFQIFPYPDRLKLLMPFLLLYQQSGLQTLVRSTGLLKKWLPNLAAMEEILPRLSWDTLNRDFPETIPAQGTQRYRVGMILGCVQRTLFSGVNAATLRALTANGCEVVIPPSQGCCSALPAHQGQTNQAQAIARQMIDAFAATNVDYIIINAAGCGHTLKEYHHILQDDPQYRDRAAAFVEKVRDIHEFFAEVGWIAPLQPIAPEPVMLVYHDACHLLHGQKISAPPRDLLRQIPGVTLREPIDSQLCCGSAGIYNLLQPEIADELGELKVQNLTNTGADAIASPNPGCSLQIQKHLGLQGKTVPVLHPIELLDRAMRGEALPKGDR